MKTLLFGLVTAAACTRVPSVDGQPPQYPLCDREGSPACGNIGQVGRAAPTPATPVVTVDAKHVFAASATSAPTTTNVPAPGASIPTPQRARPRIARTRTVATPRTEVAAPAPATREHHGGWKETRESIARNAASAAPEVATAAPSAPTANTRGTLMLSAGQGTSTSPLKPRVDHREQVVCGNVMGKGGGRRVCRDSSGGYVDPNTAFAPGQMVESDDIYK